MLLELLEEFQGAVDIVGIEETRLRASRLMANIFLQNLPVLTELDDFQELWLQVLDFIKLYMEAEHNSELVGVNQSALG